MVPSELLVQAAADAGYQSAALVDRNSVEGIPSFIDACDRHGVHPIVGMSVVVTPKGAASGNDLGDVLDLASEAQPGLGDRGFEEMALLVLSKPGYQNLLRLIEITNGKSDGSLRIDEILDHREGLFLILGGPDTQMLEVVSGRLGPDSIQWLRKLLKTWGKTRIGFGGLTIAASHSDLPSRINTLKRLEPPIPAMACVWASYRNENDRFWGYASYLAAEGAFPTSEQPLPVLPGSDYLPRLLQGISEPFQIVERLVSKVTDPFPSGGIPMPAYPIPRGTDVDSLFWTLGQETAIATGHIKTDGGKERLVEEYQYLKQTDWPNIWIILWDLRRRLGLPASVLRLKLPWCASSLFAHLLGMTRIDPLREGIPFAPEEAVAGPGGGLSLEVEGPEDWTEELVREAVALLGKSRLGILGTGEREDINELREGGKQLVATWEDLDFGGDRPGSIPPLPSYLKTDNEPGATDQVHLLLSATNLTHIFGPQGIGYPYLASSAPEALRLGGLVLNVVSTPAQTLAAAASYRGTASEESPENEGVETVSDWIDSHRGEGNLGNWYKDGGGRFDQLAYSSSLVRLVTQPGSAGYRPLLWKWIHETHPSSLSELANLLALAWHWSHWGSHPERREAVISRSHPFRRPENSPSWLSQWERFWEGQLPQAKGVRDLGSALEEATLPTGGWILYRDQIELALEKAFGLNADEQEHWLSEEARSSGKAEAEEIPRGLRTFLGQPYPLPRQFEFLELAEQLLSAADAFATDPAATICVISHLFPEERIERRELYEIARQQGVSLSLQPIPGAIRQDRSPQKDCLELGTMNVLGVGPHVAADLEGLPQVEYPRLPLRRFLTEPENVPPSSFSHWLEQRSPSLITERLVLRLAGLGAFDSFVLAFEELNQGAREFFQKRRSPPKFKQQTFFAGGDDTNGDADDPSPTLEDCHPPAPGLESELSYLRFPVTGTPLDPLRDSLPTAWFENDADQRRPKSVLHGWIYEVDLFGSGDQKPTISCLLFNKDGFYRLKDKSGSLLSILPVESRHELRPDGQRIHLKSPCPVLCHVQAVQHTGWQEPPVYEVLQYETLTNFRTDTCDWSEIRATLSSGSAELAADLQGLLDWFVAPDKGIRFILEISKTAWPKALFSRRLIRNVGLRRVLPSTVLLSILSSLEGVESVETISIQDQMF